MIEQGTKEWLEMRKSYLGASDAPVVMGVSPWRSPYELWQEKLGFGQQQKDNPAMRYGREMEEEARVQYQLSRGITVSPAVIFNPETKFMMASLDGLSTDNSRAVEIKNPGAKDHQIAKEGKIPDKYYPQLQHALECLYVLHGHKEMDYFSYKEGEGVNVVVKRDLSYIKMLKEAESSFWQKVLNFVTPDLIDKDLRERDATWVKKAIEVYDDGVQASYFKKKHDEGKKLLCQMGERENSKGGGYYFKKSIRQGAVEYKNILELVGVDLNLYRKSPVESWRLTQKEG